MVLQSIRYTSGPRPSLEILDQVVLPYRSTYLRIKSCEEAHAAIKQMKVRGAPAIAIVAALALAVELGNTRVDSSDCTDIQRLIDKRLDYLKTSRPTAVNLGDAVDKLKAIIKRSIAKQGATSQDLVQAYIDSAERMLVDDIEDNKAIGKHGANWIQEHTTTGAHKRATGSGELKILTHCNTGSLATAGYGTALGVIRSLHQADFLTHAYCSETRPYNQGSRLTAYELVHDRIPATLVTDSMAAALLAREGRNIAAVVVGADRVAANGDTANKIGTYSLAVLARHHGTKFLVAAPRTTIDMSTKSGSDIEIEQRTAVEVARISGPEVKLGRMITEDEPVTISIAAPGIGIWNPAFDVTPAELIDGVITEVGVVEKSPNGQFNLQAIFEKDEANSVR